MRTLIIPDIHEDLKKVIPIIEVETFDEVVFLGDYFDSSKSSRRCVRRMAKFLKKHLEEPKFHFILGNHEFNYFKEKRCVFCSGFSEASSHLINSILSKDDWNHFLPFYETQGWLLSHAGFTSKLFVHPVKGWQRDDVFSSIMECYSEPKGVSQHKAFQAGYSRGGCNFYGGITWCDFKYDFEPIEDVKQIFGHTKGFKPRQFEDTDNWCIDTSLKYYTLLIDGCISFKKFK